MQTHELHDHELIGKALYILPPSVLYRKGKYVKILSESDGYIWHTVLDYRRYKRILRRYSQNKVTFP